ncbi:uncharacterized protein MYCGRDRAFT_91479 [Zymoseptoria tritici IPO323]|uniref:Uncharacterized protein n=1 Tax=Zymoseptoria tritici (strain CBS 115943 / IPO323) TaxID=336722 RepID=F9X5H3_ZYMTI|nr:uncharacterized protein MYCGRDRAFT_91479 [Zymoseptoria tritici IPO323]EGP88683.1 hypothetical protein MYCGRDRAFT_91479 [Zymoseptoria tritici IPO323]
MVQTDGKTEAEIKVTFSLTNTIYRRSAQLSEQPKMIVTTTLISPPTLAVELRGETDSGTILESGFRMEHFEFFDLTTSTMLKHSLFPGTCDPRESVGQWGVVELHSSKALVTSQQLEDMSPLADPIRDLKAGHEYRLRLKRIPGYAMSMAELFGEKQYVDVRNLPETVVVELKSDDEVILAVED